MTKYWWRTISVGLKQVKVVTDIKIFVTYIQKLSPRSSHQHLYSQQEQVPFMIVNLIFVFSTFDLVELGYLAKGGFQIRITCNNKGLNKFEISIKTDQRRWKAIFINFVDSYTLTLIPPIDDFLRLLTFTSTVILHDAFYQFLRIFYYSRFKPPSLRNDFDVISWLISNCRN